MLPREMSRGVGSVLVIVALASLALQGCGKATGAAEGQTAQLTKEQEARAGAVAQAETAKQEIAVLTQQREEEKRRAAELQDRIAKEADKAAIAEQQAETAKREIAVLTQQREEEKRRAAELQKQLTQEQEARAAAVAQAETAKQEIAVLTQQRENEKRRVAELQDRIAKEADKAAIAEQQAETAIGESIRLAEAAQQKGDRELAESYLLNAATRHPASMRVLRSYARLVVGDGPNSRTEGTLVEIDRLTSILQMAAFQVQAADLPAVLKLVEAANRERSARLDATAPNVRPDIIALLKSAPSLPNEFTPNRLRPLWAG